MGAGRAIKPRLRCKAIVQNIMLDPDDGGHIARYNQLDRNHYYGGVYSQYIGASRTFVRGQRIPPGPPSAARRFGCADRGPSLVLIGYDACNFMMV